MTKIAYLTSQYPATSHTFIRREVEALRQTGINITTFSIRKPSTSEQVDAENRAAYGSTFYVQSQPFLIILMLVATGLARSPLRSLRTLRDAMQHRVPGLSALVYSLVYFVEAMVLADVLKRRGMQHLHVHFANAAAIVGYLATRHLDIGLSLTLHGISEFDYPAGMLLRRKLEQAQFVACASSFCRAQAMRASNPHDWAKMFVSRCGIDIARFRPLRELRGAQRPRLLHVGRLSAEKGQAGLLLAFSELRQRGTDAELRIIGDGPLEVDLKTQAQALGVDAHCVFLGRQGESAVIHELREADVLVLSSFMEGLPVVLMEAMACEVAVVAPNVAGIPELVVDGSTGLLYAPGEWSEMCSQLHRIVTDADTRDRLAHAGRAMVLRQHNIHTAVMPLAQRFRDLDNPAHGR